MPLHWINAIPMTSRGNHNIYPHPTLLSRWFSQLQRWKMIFFPRSAGEKKTNRPMRTSGCLYFKKTCRIVPNLEFSGDSFIQRMDDVFRNKPFFFVKWPYFRVDIFVRFMGAVKFPKQQQQPWISKMSLKDNWKVSLKVNNCLFQKAKPGKILASQKQPSL